MEKKKKEINGLKAPKKLKILVTIVERTKTDFYLSALESFGVNMQTVLYAKGTAPTEIATMLGIVDSGKALILSVANEDIIPTIIAEYEDNYFKLRNSKGIAFTIPISSIIGVFIYNFLANNEMEES